MQTRANAEPVVYSGKSQGQADKDSQYKIRMVKNRVKVQIRNLMYQGTEGAGRNRKWTKELKSKTRNQMCS